MALKEGERSSLPETVPLSLRQAVVPLLIADQGRVEWLGTAFLLDETSGLFATAKDDVPNVVEVRRWSPA